MQKSWLHISFISPVQIAITERSRQDKSRWEFISSISLSICQTIELGFIFLLLFVILLVFNHVASNFWNTAYIWESHRSWKTKTLATTQTKPSNRSVFVTTNNMSMVLKSSLHKKSSLRNGEKKNHSLDGSGIHFVVPFSIDILALFYSVKQSQIVSVPCGKLCNNGMSIAIYYQYYNQARTVSKTLSQRWVCWFPVNTKKFSWRLKRMKRIWKNWLQRIQFLFIVRKVICVGILIRILNFTVVQKSCISLR